VSRTRGFAISQGISDSPSGQLPSCLDKPDGSFVAEIPAELRDH